MGKNKKEFQEISRKISNNQFESLQEKERFASLLIYTYKNNNAKKKDLLIKIYLGLKDPTIIRLLINGLCNIVSSDIIIQFFQLLKDLGAINSIIDTIVVPNYIITKEIEDFVIRTIVETRKTHYIRPLFFIRDYVDRKKFTEAVFSTGDIKFIIEYNRECGFEINDEQLLVLYGKIIESGNPENIYWFIEHLELMSMGNINIFNALVQALIDLGDFKCISLLIKEKKDFVQRNGYVNQLFIAIIKLLEIETLPEVKIENILVKYTEVGVFDINILVDFLVYWAQQIAQGVNIFEEPTQIGEGSIGGRQFVLLPKT